MNFSDLIFKDTAGSQQLCVGILGGGGKTALLHRLGNELACEHAPVILSSLTKAGISAQHPVHLYAEFAAEETREDLLQENPVYIMQDYEHAEKLLGLAEAELFELLQASAMTVFECDGARKRPLKAHQPFDPVMPHFTTHAIIVVGADAVGAKVDGKRVHRPELFRELWQVNANTILEPALIAKVVTSQYGYLQKVPADIPVLYLVNKADAYPQAAGELARAINRISKAPVFMGSVKQGSLEAVHEW